MYSVTNNGKKAVTLPGCILQPGSTVKCDLSKAHIDALVNHDWLDIDKVEIPKKKKKKVYK